ncbi:MAG: hypothetical protein JWQ07_1654 [Ramlibacter sp.]|nr:hypothetical protein [Ramlibacter sp.]
MSQLSPAVSTRLKGSELVGPCHACAFFSDPEEEYRVLLPFASDCAQCGERCLLFLDPAHEQERRERLIDAGIEIGVTPAVGVAELRIWDDVYLRGGRFDQHEMLSLIEEALRGGRQSGRTRLWANMEWVLKGLPGSEDLIEYEARLNPLVEQHTDIVICAYEHGKYSASVVMDILRTHPMMVVGDSVQPNPLYVPTQQFLKDLRQRRAARPGLRSEPRAPGEA